MGAPQARAPCLRKGHPSSQGAMLAKRAPLKRGHPSSTGSPYARTHQTIPKLTENREKRKSLSLLVWFLKIGSICLRPACTSPRPSAPRAYEPALVHALQRLKYIDMLELTVDRNVHDRNDHDHDGGAHHKREPAASRVEHDWSARAGSRDRTALP